MLDSQQIHMVINDKIVKNQNVFIFRICYVYGGIGDRAVLNIDSMDIAVNIEL